MKKYNVCVVGATGAVGRTILKCLEERNFPVNNLYPLASKRSAGNTIPFNGTDVTVHDLETFDFTKAEIGLFSPGASVSKIYAPRAAESGCVVIDNTSHFRMHPEVPLVVPEVNAYAIADYKKTGIIANPNCSTIQMLVALKPIYDKVGISRINVCTYQAVSGSGMKAIKELQEQSKLMLAGDTPECSVYPKIIAFNAIPQVDSFTDNGYTKEEMKMVNETRKIFADNSIEINPTTVRIPVFYGHAEALHIETKEKITAGEALECLSNLEGVTVIDEQVDGGYPTNLDSAGKDSVYVGRIREDISHPLGLNLWVVADNVRKGAATNTVQIAEKLIENYL